ncbi:hypothetical protein TREMEDRAFT_29049 [Tremella mesenterica DSM 1558]|uniref:uncharacterized protein n=1 Tax=Tremella mesenterica (strain ATCC 24925 / CBS 8224 / DSM 1558 / NBRC 9311 / NRRL Y-6157 / RJB 2259-6 / UBC 559-6) TaxID=578456 RepID=UPI0003F49D9E|nr:uncharacterized protein TREMEDRAFT_29049 [Tremella mesenterica DSM 1558]EIW70676.1 hypothetical protein TREMEDRAFT_29049 [Tremella mesenterica DSM 1558]
MVTSAPTVTLLDPPIDLSKDHHGPPASSSYTSYISLDTSKPRYFQNPWPSYRSASLNDAWLAYQKGAAIAYAQTHSIPPKRISSGASNHDDEEALLEVEADVEEIPKIRRVKSRVYVRPSFSEIRDEDEEDDWRDPPVTVVAPKWEKTEKETVTWLGHASVLARIPWEDKSKEGMCGLLFDPIFSYRCSPSQYVGPARHLDPPCSVSELPEIHACFISHDHYDHLDHYTILDLWKYHAVTIHFFVPYGLKKWFESCSIPSDRITEFDWWHEALLSFPPSSTSPSSDSSDGLMLKVAFTPAQHRSGRGVLDHMTTLWGSWVVGVVSPSDVGRAQERGMNVWQGFKMFFGGDTGYRYATSPTQDPLSICPAFTQIASLYSPFSLSCLPISTGSSLPFLRTLLSLSLDQYTLTSALHCSPADAISIHRILGAERGLGIHWGTFCDSDEARGTRVEFGRVRRSAGLGTKWDEKGCFVVCDIGQTLEFEPFNSG